jgi:hypothetical protein
MPVGLFPVFPSCQANSANKKPGYYARCRYFPFLTSFVIIISLNAATVSFLGEGGDLPLAFLASLTTS